MFGAATASIQIEGVAPEDGGRDSIWDLYARQDRIKNHNTLDIACDSYHRYEEDFKLLKGMGANTYRFSIPWARIIPNGYDGVINQKAVEHYKKVIDKCLEYELIPMVTLYHWEMPTEVYKRGGFLNESVSDWFAEFVRVVADNFAGKVKMFITINEPSSITGGMGGMDYSEEMSDKDFYTCVHNLLLCHGKAVKILREYKDVKVGIGPCQQGGIPLSNDDIEAARKFFFEVPYKGDRLKRFDSTSLYMDPIVLGDYPEEFYKKVPKEGQPDIKPGDMELISQKIDFVGLNIYSSLQIKKADNKIGYEIIPYSNNRDYCFDGIWPYSPEGIYWMIRFMEERYHLPMYITENGCCSNDVIGRDGKIHDDYRIQVLDGYFSYIKKARLEGYDIRGYIVWTLMDNFEWIHGYTKRFGLVYTNFNTLERTPKESYYFFKDLIEKNKDL